MNTETGKVYEGAEIDAAIARGEKLATISHVAAARIREGRRLLAIKMRAREREHKTKKQRRVRDRQQKASRKANRRR
jgi:hypothetical protein